MISVIIPAFNAEATLERAVDSVLSQRGVGLEVIVVDDGSADGTAELAEYLARRDTRVRAVRMPHRGPGAARNTGLDLATGDWVAFLDADDEFAPQAFRTVLDRIARRRVGLVIFSIEYVSSYLYAWPTSPEPLDDYLYPAQGGRAVAFMGAYLRAQRMLVYPTSNKLFRRDLLESHQIRFDENLTFGEDRLFVFAYLRRVGAVLTMSDQLLRYSVGLPGTLSTGPARGDVAAMRVLSSAKLDLFRDFGYSEPELEPLRRRDETTILQDLLDELVTRDRMSGRGAVLRGVRAALRAGVEVRSGAIDVGRSRHAQTFQRALASRSALVSAMFVRSVRRADERAALERRRGEINHAGELERLELTTANARERRRYLFLDEYERFLDQVNDARVRHLARDKAITLRRLAAAPGEDLLRRQWLDLRRASLEEFAALLERHPRIVAKPFAGASGRGVEVIDTRSGSGSVPDLHERLVGSKKYVVEQHLNQHPVPASVYGGALATMRIHTLTLGPEARIVLPATISFGSGGGVTSNAWSIQSFVNLETGELMTDGIYQGPHGRGLKPDEVLTRHPDSLAPFRGLVVPFVTDARRMVLHAARCLPELPFLGWDVAFTPHGPAIIEANAAPMFHYSWQNMARILLGTRGMRSEVRRMQSEVERFKARSARRSARV